MGRTITFNDSKTWEKNKKTGNPVTERNVKASVSFARVTKWTRKKAAVKPGRDV